MSVPPKVQAAAAALAEPRPMRRGSLSERYMKCGKGGCPCGEKAEARHGPYFSLTRAVGGKTSSRYLTTQQGEIARQQIEAGQEFRTQVEDYWQACEAWADSGLESAGADARKAEDEKKGSKRTSKRRSRPRSKRS